MTTLRLSRRSIAIALALLLMGLIAVVLTTAPAYAADQSDQCTPQQVPSDLAMQGCDLPGKQPGQPTTTAPPPTHQQSTAPPPTTKSASPQPTTTTGSMSPKPTTAPQEWNAEVTDSTGKLLTELDKVLRDGAFAVDMNKLAPYAVSLGIGWVLMAITLTISFGKLAGAPDSPSGLEILRASGSRALGFPVIAGLFPAAVTWLYGMSTHLGQYFMGQAVDTNNFYSQIGDKLKLSANPLDWLGIGVIQVFAFLALGVCALFLIFELAMAEFAGYVLMCLAPPLLALSISAPWARRAFWGLVAAITALMLTPAIAWFVMWCAQMWIGNRMAEQGPWPTLVSALVALFVSAVTPIGVGLVMAKLTGALGSAGDEGASARNRAEQLARAGGGTAWRGLKKAAKAVDNGVRANTNDERHMPEVSTANNAPNNDPGPAAEQPANSPSSSERVPTAHNDTSSSTDLSATMANTDSSSQLVQAANSEVVADAASTAASQAAQQGGQQVVAEQAAASAAPGVGNAVMAAVQVARGVGTVAKAGYDVASERAQDVGKGPDAPKPGYDVASERAQDVGKGPDAPKPSDGDGQR